MAGLPRCNAAGKPKVRYPSNAAAIKRALISSRRRGTPLRPYCCPSCKGWHLSSRPSFDIRNKEAAS